MKNIIIIAAVGPNNELGKNNDLIWRIPEDMKFFRENTVNKPIVMGINTFYSLPGILPNRKHIVLTHQELEENDDIIVFNNMDDLLNYIENIKKEVMIIGGAQIYKQFLPYTDTMLLTEIEEINDDIVADKYFPEFDKEEWDRKLLSEHNYEDIKYKRLKYTRK